MAPEHASAKNAAALEAKHWIIIAAAGALVLVVLVIGLSVSARSGGGGGGSVPADVARLKLDGYTIIKTGVSNYNLGCSHYAIGEDSNGDGYGELVVQCPSSYDAGLTADNIGGIVDGNLVIKQGPLSGL